MIRLLNSELMTIDEPKKKENKDQWITTIRSAVETGPNGRKIAKPIISVLHFYEHDFNCENTRLRVIRDQNGKSILSISQSQKNQYDTDVFVMAVPYCGVIKPMKKPEYAEIFKGFIVHSDKKDILFQGEAFNKIAFLVFRLNTRKLEPLSLESDKLKLLSIETFNFSGFGKDRKTVKTTWDVFISQDTSVDFVYQKEDVEPIDIAEFKKVPAFPIYDRGATNEKKWNSDHKAASEKSSDSEEENNQHLNDMLDQMRKQDREKRSDDYRKKNKSKRFKKRR